MRHQVAVLVDRAALHRYIVPDGGNCLFEPRRPVDNKELGAPQAAFNEIVKHCPPSFRTFAAHALDREQHLLPILTHTQHDEQ